MFRHFVDGKTKSFKKCIAWKPLLVIRILIIKQIEINTLYVKSHALVGNLVRGIEWFLEKSLRNFWPDLEILEAFLMGLEVSFVGDFSSRSLEFW